MRRTVPHLLSLALLATAACADAPTAPPALRRGPSPTVLASAGNAEACVPDSKLIGRIEIAGRDEPGTWWHLTRTGFDAAGITDYLATIQNAFGIAFPDLQTAVDYLVAQVEPLDSNGNGFVCAYRGRGVVAATGDPFFWEYHFRVKDDKHVAP